MASSKQKVTSNDITSQTEEEISFKQGAEGGAKELSSETGSDSVSNDKGNAGNGDSDKWDIISKQLEGICNRLDRLESQSYEQKSTEHNVSPGVNAATVSDVQRDFERIRDSLIRIPVPEGLKVHDNSAGISKDQKPALKILSKCARYSETALKVLQQVKSVNESTDSELSCVYTCLAAQVNYLQSEFTSIVVKSTFDDDTTRVFRQFENNTAIFSDEALRNVRVAAELSALSQRSGARQRNTSNYNRGFGNRGRFPRGDSFPDRDRGYNRQQSMLPSFFRNSRSDFRPPSSGPMRDNDS